MKINLSKNQGISSMGIVLLIIVVIMAIGIVWYGVRNNDQNDNTNTVRNTELNNNSNFSSSLNIDPISGLYTFTNKDIGMSFQFPGSWYPTEMRSKSNSSLETILTFSNENTDGVLGLNSREEGIVGHIIVEEFSGLIGKFLDNNPVRLGELISQSNIVIDSIGSVRREVDATRIDNMEGSYSVEYFIPRENKVIRIIFLSLSKEAIDVNSQTLNSIIDSLSLFF